MSPNQLQFAHHGTGRSPAGPQAPYCPLLCRCPIGQASVCKLKTEVDQSGDTKTYEASAIGHSHLLLTPSETCPQPSLSSCSINKSSSSSFELHVTVPTWCDRGSRRQSIIYFWSFIDRWRNTVPWWMASIYSWRAIRLAFSWPHSIRSLLIVLGHGSSLLQITGQRSSDPSMPWTETNKTSLWSTSILTGAVDEHGFE